MSGTKSGGLKAAVTNRSNWGDDFYSKIGKVGGLVGTTGGFAQLGKGRDGLTGRQRASKYGRKGGKISTRSAKPESLKVRRSKVRRFLKSLGLK